MNLRNRADGIGEIEGKAATGSGEGLGKGASFKCAQSADDPLLRPLRSKGSPAHSEDLQSSMNFAVVCMCWALPNP